VLIDKMHSIQMKRPNATLLVLPVFTSIFRMKNNSIT